MSVLDFESACTHFQAAIGYAEESGEVERLPALRHNLSLALARSGRLADAASLTPTGSAVGGQVRTAQTEAELSRAFEHAQAGEWDEALRVIAYHPDTDTGPTHTDHPMINRTYIEGRSASHLPTLQTQALERP